MLQRLLGKDVALCALPQSYPTIGGVLQLGQTRDAAMKTRIVAVDTLEEETKRSWPHHARRSAGRRPARSALARESGDNTGKDLLDPKSTNGITA